MPALFYKKIIMDCEIITVNYNTPDLIDRLVNSIRLKEGIYLSG